MTSERTLQNYLIHLAINHGIYVRKVEAVGHTGFPDLFLARYGRMALVEVKSPTGKGRLSKKQQQEIARLDEAGVNVYVIDSYEEADNVIRQLADA